MSSLPSPRDRAAFYGAAVVGLRALDAREPTPRRFGRDADFRWEQFSGALGAADRLDLLLRDAAGTWGAAFSPSDCFGFFGLAEDEPFGPDWIGLADQAALRMFAPAGAAPTLTEAATALGIQAAAVTVPPLTPSTRLILAGGGAILAVAQAFATAPTLSWTDQVVVAASNAAFRQLGALAAVLLGARGRTVLIRPGEGAEAALRAAGFAHLDAAVVSSDAEPEAAELSRKVGGR